MATLSRSAKSSARTSCDSPVRVCRCPDVTSSREPPARPTWRAWRSWRSGQGPRAMPPRRPPSMPADFGPVRWDRRSADWPRTIPWSNSGSGGWRRPNIVGRSSVGDAFVRSAGSSLVRTPEQTAGFSDRPGCGPRLRRVAPPAARNHPSSATTTPRLRGRRHRSSSTARPRVRHPGRPSRFPGSGPRRSPLAPKR